MSNKRRVHVGDGNHAKKSRTDDHHRTLHSNYEENDVKVVPNKDKTALNSSSNNQNVKLLWQPCDRPYEYYRKSGIGLNFNFWMENRHLLDSDLSSLITKILRNENCSVEYLRSEESIQAESIYIVGLHGLDPTTIAQNEKNMKFLSSCTIVPVRHSTAHGNQWRPNANDIEPMSSLLLWSEKPSLSLKQISCLDVALLFDKYILTFDGKNGDWIDKVVFHSDLSAVNQIQAFNANLGAGLQNTIEVDLRVGDVIGRFKRVHHLDAGVFRLRILANNVDDEDADASKSPTVSGSTLCFELSLMWYKRPLEVVVAVPSTNGLPLLFDGSAESAVGSLTLTVVKAIVSEKSKGGIVTESLIGVKLEVVDEDIVDPNNISKKQSDVTTDKDRETMSLEDLLRVYKTLREEGEELKEPMVAVPFAPASLDEEILRSLRELYDLVMSEHFEDFRQLLLSGTMMGLLGYPDAEELEKGSYISTTDYRWRPPNTDAIHNNQEEGEEEEEAVEDITLDICALDCEMVLTENGYELARLTVVSPSRPGGVALDILVKPENAVLDYCTEFSGISEPLLRQVTTTKAEAMVQLRRLISSSTILVGHSLDSDLRCLKLSHRQLIDTAALYPHPRGAPYKLGLKKLAADFLGLSIRENTSHDSCQDAVISLELALLKAKAGAESAFGIPGPWSAGGFTPRHSMLDDAIFGHNSTTAEVSVDNQAMEPSPAPPLLSGKCVVHSCPPLADKLPWERLTAGYRPESDAVWAISHTTAAPEGLPAPVCEMHKAAKEAFDAALRDSVARPAFMWLDMPMQGAKSGSSGSCVWSTIFEADCAIAELFASMAPGGLLLVVTQGDVADLRESVCRKQRVVWEERKQFGGAPIGPWTDEDEEDMLKRCTNVLSGAAFLSLKR